MDMQQSQGREAKSTRQSFFFKQKRLARLAEDTICRFCKEEEEIPVYEGLVKTRFLILAVKNLITI